MNLDILAREQITHKMELARQMAAEIERRSAGLLEFARQDIQKETKMEQTEIIKRIRAAMQYHRGESNKIDRAALVRSVWGPAYIEDNSNNNYQDRAVRLAIAEIRDTDLIVSTTKHGGGYWIAANLAEAEKIAADYVRRSRVMERKARRVRQRAREYFGGQFEMDLENAAPG